MLRPWKSTDPVKPPLRLILFLGIACGGGSLRAATVTLTPVADTTLFQHNPENNLGAEPTLASGATAGALINRALLKFDIAGSIPSNATIRNVTLTLTVTRTIATQPSLFDLHRVLL